jgi:uncharacterized protein YcfJ
MKHTVLFAALGLVAFGAAAQEVGHVISSTPVVQQVAVPRQNCVPGMVSAQPQTSGMGGLTGGIAGAAIGSQIGAGTGTAAAMLVGTVAGALLGNTIEGNGIRAQQAAVPTCTTENSYENRTVGYDVAYEYAGRQYTTRMPYDPGATVRLQVSTVAQGGVAPGAVVSAPPVQGLAQAPAVVPAPAPVVVQQPYPVAQQPYPVMQQPYPVAVQPYPPVAVYPAPYPYPVYQQPYFYPPVGVSLGFVFGGHGHGGHRHWR